MKTMIKKNKNINEEGFTLIEIVAVVLIIGILVAISVPVYINQQKEAYISTLKSDLKNAGEYMENSFTPEKGYPTTIDGVNTSDGNTLILKGGGITVETPGTNTGTIGYGNTGNTRPTTPRSLTKTEFDTFNNTNTGQPYMSFVDKTTTPITATYYTTAFLYDSNSITNLETLESVFFNTCSFVKNQTITGYTPNTPTENYGKNACYTYTTMVDEEQLNATRETIKVINELNSQATPSFTIGTPITEYSFTNNGYYVILVTKDFGNSEVWGGSETRPDIQVFKISNNDTVTQPAPNVWCESGTVFGKNVLTVHTSGSRDYCGSPAISSSETPDSFWGSETIPDIPPGLLEDEAVVGEFGAYCIEGHNESSPAEEDWYHISAIDSKVKTGRCP